MCKNKNVVVEESLSAIANALDKLAEGVLSLAQAQSRVAKTAEEGVELARKSFELQTQLLLGVGLPEKKDS